MHFRILGFQDFRISGFYAGRIAIWRFLRTIRFSLVVSPALVDGMHSALPAAVNEQAAALSQRAREFAVRLIRFLRTLPLDPVTRELTRQLVKAGSGVSANYHATCRARSRAEFIAKLGIVVEEADETEHWLHLLIETGIASGSEVEWLDTEAHELRAIFKASVDTARRNHPRRQATSR
jgi:four helix bundle protein